MSRRWHVMLVRPDFIAVSHGRSFWSYRSARRYADRMNASKHTIPRWLVINR